MPKPTKEQQKKKRAKVQKAWRQELKKRLKKRG